MFLPLLVCFFVLLIYYTLFKPLTYWKDRNVPHIKPWPVLGNALPMLTGKHSITEFIEMIYHQFPNERYVGIFSFRNPQLMIKDLNLVKRIGVKDFDYFTNRTVQITEKVEPLFGRALISLLDQKWRDMRATLSPTFTSSKMRFMFNLVSDCAVQFVDHFLDEDDGDVIEVDTKDVSTRFTNDAIATAAFGIHLNSLEDKTNDFFLMGKDLNNVTTWRALKLLGYSIFPALMRLLKVPLLPGKYLGFFTNIVKGNIREREEKGLVRPDLIHILLERRQGKGTDEDVVPPKEFAISNEVAVESRRIVELTDEDIVAQALMFFFAGFETTSTLICFMCHELAANPDVQQRLQEEINDVLKRCDGKVTYEALLSMKYLDMVVSETLRLWPPGILLERVCAKDYAIPSDDGQRSITVKKGVSVTVPVFAIHRDPKYFSDPNSFSPERFSDQNKCTIKPFSYLPFGVGPRICIASRFALMETKILFFHLLSKFELVPTKKTTIPMVLTRKKIILAPENGFWVGLRRRSTPSH
ncbi:hypothetical protein PPYR_13861 [Photinus pyralis]|uniref:Cytochrome P450 n=1 Tax=Photinus pyralis TaxID=7054 RepID=A0A5N4AA93_PHOPY|nr:cytochrome P450 9e2-like [Photinus pyralis]XP_031353845.1 cytochrome P450 9e2-like [Photinus pyralis]XP_031353846.1 cytochrome P450 9e2-like [Photinus pyralis]XP_031353847.1 cytochrome P450 9e2-like [Photinus pyralis]XP_031353848.1 cytochrome P450 9e2-like [Photinus pyralis]XP_031353849.1 cytochrome P450 9e2-like [Photinus pyralis]KAB0794241.1 hypothetical protein PPYR_13861 [Photinus pyralis]